MSAVIGTRPRIYLACARSFCEAPNLGPTKGSRPAEWGRPTCRRPVCRCGVVAARCADGVRSGGVSGRAAALQALRCASYRPRGGCTRVYKKMLSCTVPCTRQVWTLCVILSDLNRPELCFIEWHWSLCALLTSKSAVRDPSTTPVLVSCIYIGTLTYTVTRGPMLTCAHAGGDIRGLTVKPAHLRAHLATLHTRLCGSQV